MTKENLKEYLQAYKSQIINNTLIINDFRDFACFIEKNKTDDRSEYMLTLVSALAVSMCKPYNADKLKLKAHMTGNNTDDFVSADIEIRVKNLKVKK